MPLIPNPPCFTPLVGCTEDGILGIGPFGSGIASIGDGDLSIGGGNSNDSTTPSSSSAGLNIDALKANLREYASSSPLLNRPQKTIAEYVITAKNMSAEMVRGITINHGPLPFGASFVREGSDPRCSLSGKSVACLLNLRPSESQSMTLRYEASHGFNCAFSRILERAKVAYTVVRTGEVPPVVTTVQCSTKTIARDGGFFADDGSNAGDGGGSGVGGISDGNNRLGSNGTFSNGGVNGVELSDTVTNKAELGGIVGGYSGVFPQTGVMNNIMIESDTSFITLPQSSTSSSHQYFFESLSFILLIGIVCIMKTARRWIA